MKKFLAILMTLAMLMTSCAFAEATEPQSARIVLDDIVIYEGETAILDLSGLGLSLSVYEDAANTSLQLALTAADEDVAGLRFGVDGSKLLLGMTGVSNVYSVEVAEAIQHIAVEANLIEEGEEVDFASIISEEDQLALAELIAEAVTMYVESGETTTEEIDGVTYDITNNYLSFEQMDVLIQKAHAILDSYPQLLEGSGYESFTQMYEAIKPTMAFHFSTYSNETEFDFVATLMDTFIGYTGEEEGLNLTLDVENTLTSENSVDTHVELLVAHNEAEYTIAFNMEFVDQSENSWVPATDAAIDLFDALADEEQSNLLLTEVVTTAVTALAAAAESNETVAALMEAAAAE